MLGKCFAMLTCNYFPFFTQPFDVTIFFDFGNLKRKAERPGRLFEKQILFSFLICFVHY